jgi:hypothetical protein
VEARGLHLHGDAILRLAPVRHLEIYLARRRPGQLACLPHLARLATLSLHGERLVPLRTTKVQLNEKWSFVGKKPMHCTAGDEAEWFQGDQWDHVAPDPDHRLVIAAGLFPPPHLH